MQNWAMYNLPNMYASDKNMYIAVEREFRGKLKRLLKLHSFCVIKSTSKQTK